MRARQFTMAFAAVALASVTWAADSAMPASEQAKKQLKQEPAAKNVQKQAKMKRDANSQALDKATQSEAKKFNTLSNASKSRHSESMNSIRNQR